jgi:hypothetical protein
MSRDADLAQNQGGMRAAPRPDGSSDAAHSRKLVRYWLVRLGTAVPLSVFCVVASGLAIGNYIEAERQWLAFHNINGDMGRGLSEVQSVVAAIRAAPAAAEQPRLLHWAEECSEELVELRRQFGLEVRDHPVYEETTAAWDEVVTTITAAGPGPESVKDRGKTLERAVVELTVFRDQYGELSDVILAGIIERQQQARRWLYAGIAPALGVALLCAWTAASILAEHLTGRADLASLEQTISNISRSRAFQARMTYLCRKKGLPETPDTWNVSLTRVVSTKQTHTCFEAVGRSGDTIVQLWGRQYRWTGWFRAVSRIFFPMYAEATYRALCLLSSRGVSAPEVLYYKRHRKGPFRAGSILLTEHLGKLTPFKDFADAGFRLLPEQARRTMVKRLAQFVSDIQEAGIYHVSPRYIHGRNYDDPEGKAEFYLCDLDKVLIWEHCPQFIARWLRRRDLTRLERRLRLGLGPADIAILKKLPWQGR